MQRDSCVWTANGNIECNMRDNSESMEPKVVFKSTIVSQPVQEMSMKEQVSDIMFNEKNEHFDIFSYNEMKEKLKKPEIKNITNLKNSLQKLTTNFNFGVNK